MVQIRWKVENGNMQTGKPLKKFQSGKALGGAVQALSEVLQGAVVFPPVFAIKGGSTFSRVHSARVVILCSVVEEKFGDAGLPAGGVGSAVLSLTQQELTDE